MATISVGRGNAPGTYIYESAIASQSGTASFNTVYMMVEAPQEASVAVFPFNRPVFVGSLNEYENLIGGAPTGGAELDSYYAVKAFFQQCTIGDLRVTRVGIPSNITEVAFDPSANKDNGVSAPSAMAKGDLVYVKLEINGVQLGDKTSSGAWLGVPVTIPVDYVSGDTDNNLKISTAIRDAVRDAIEANADISASVYVRQVGTGDPACAECAFLYLTGRVFNGPAEVVNSNEVTGSQFILSSAGYDIGNVDESEESVYDWIQCVRTAFNEPNLPQGYMIAPAAFKKFKKTDRVNLGQSMEEVCSDQLHKWMALVDCGPFNVTSIVEYSAYEEHDPADGFEYSGTYLADNAIYEWTDTSPLNFTSVEYDPNSAARSTNSLISDGERRALKDDQKIRSDVGVNTSTEVITLAEDWPVEALPSGTLVSVELFENTPLPTAPLYSDAATGVTNQPLLGSFFVITSDVDLSLEPNQIRLATSKGRALAGTGVNFATAGTPQGGGFLVFSYSTPAWKFEVEINKKISDLIEVNNGGASASFNALHLPGSLQDPTEKQDFRALIRQLTDPSKAIITGGLSLSYFNSSDISTASSTILIPGHGYSTGDAVNYYTLPSSDAVTPSPLSSGTVYYVIKIDDNTIKLATSLADAQAVPAVPVILTNAGTNSSTVLNPAGGAAQSILTTGGDALIFSSEHGVVTADRLYFDDTIGTATTTLFTGTTATATVVYFAEKVDRNFFRLAVSSSNLAAGAFVDFPSTAITTTTARRFYKRLSNALDGGSFSEAGIARFVRGRKYQLDATLSIFLVKDEAGVGIVSGQDDPYGDAYTADVSTALRLSYSSVPDGSTILSVSAADVDDVDDQLIITNHGYQTGDEIVINTATGATLAGGLTTATTYFVIRVDANTIQLARTSVDAAVGNPVSITSTGTDNGDNIEFFVEAASTPYTFQYTENSIAEPLNNAQDFAGEDNFYCVPLSTGQQANTSATEIYFHPILATGSSLTTLYGGYVNIEFVEPEADVPANLWNFRAITNADLISEALRGVNNGGVPQVKTLEVGMSNHSRLFSESQSYQTSQGFLAYYAPYIKNDVGVYIAPTSFVAGLAIRRYRDETGGFRLPPAGTKYTLAGARGVEINITSAQQEVSNGAGLNALRQLPGYSTVDPDTGEVFGPVYVWGSRTRVNRANATQALYQFVNTRVILNVIYGSLRQAFDGQIFNVIDGRAVTFNQIRTLASNILYSNFYVPGALFGATPADAFQVIVDDRNNPASALDQGLVNVKIFVVPVPTLERIEIDLVRVNIGGIQTALNDLGLS